MQNVYQFTCGIEMLAWVEKRAYLRRWPRSFVVVDCIERNLDAVTQADADAQRVRGLTHSIGNATVSQSLAAYLLQKQAELNASQGVIVRACIAKEMQKEA